MPLQALQYNVRRCPIKQSGSLYYEKCSLTFYISQSWLLSIYPLTSKINFLIWLETLVLKYFVLRQVLMWVLDSFIKNKLK